MNKTIQSFSLLRRAALTLLVAVMAILTAGATEFITDVMLIGGTEREVNLKKISYQQEGWKVINQDLNAGCGSSSDYIYLLYKTADNFSTPNLTFITGFYISNEENYSGSYYFNRNRYYLVPYDGGDHFKSLKGDLNSNAGGDDIHLYYTRERITDDIAYHAVKGITFNTTKDGAVGKNGGTTGYDLNAGCGSGTAYIYMHLSTEQAHWWNLERSTDNLQWHIRDHWKGNTESVKTVPAIIEGAVVSGIFLDDYRNFTNLETFYFYEGIDITSMPLVTGCASFAHVHVVDGNSTIVGYDELPHSITTIPDNAFKGTKIEHLEIPNVSSIGSSAFSGCSSLTSFTIPNSVTSIGSGAFSGCTNLTSVTINSNAILSKNYSSSSSLKDFFGNQVNTYTIGNTVTSIGKNAFNGCSGLTSVIIGSKVSSIGAGIFVGCPNLETLSVAPDNATYDSRESCNAIIESSSNTLIVGCKNTIISNSVTSIGKSAFEGCSGLTSIDIPEGVATMSNGAFSGCANLTSVTINSNAILSKNYSISSSLKDIFGKQVNTYTIGNAVTSIGGYAFNGCSGLTSVTIPNSVTSIGGNAFSGCSGLTSVTIGSKVRSIGGRAFAICPKLATLSVASDNTTYDSRENCNAIIESSSNKLIAGCKSTIIPNGVTCIGEYAFYYCSGLTSVTIPNSVTSIGGFAFRGCSGLTSVTIPNSVTSIGENAFKRCSGLTSITIPNSVTSIGGYAFTECFGLTSISIPESVTSIGEEAFKDCSSLTSATISSKVRSIGVGIFAGCPKLETLSVAPDNAVYDSRENCNAIIESSSNTLIAGCKSTIIPESVTSLGKEAFYKCLGLTSVTIPNSVTSIAEFAFDVCSDLASITIGNSVTSIGANAFHGCSGLTSITIPNSLTSIGVFAFYGCSGLTSVTIPNSVTNIGADAFFECTGMTDVYCYANPAGLTWDEWDCNDFKENRGTNCHVFNTSDWSDFESEVNVTFVGDLAIDFADNADNSTSISTWKEDGRKVNARLKDRTLYKDGAWNTLCLPFDVDDFAGTPLEGATVMAFSDASFAAGTLTLNFAEVTSLTAGEPFIVKWPVGTDIANPVFKDVYISTQTAAKETDVVTFQGIYAPLKIEGEDNTLLYVGAGDKLYWPNAAMSIGAFRAYFQLNGGLTVGDGSSDAVIRRTVLNFGDGTTSIDAASPKSSPEGKDFGSPLLQEGTGEALYDLSGRKVNSQGTMDNSPLAPGIYIRNGKKIIVK